MIEIISHNVDRHLDQLIAMANISEANGNHNKIILIQDAPKTRLQMIKEIFKYHKVIVNSEDEGKTQDLITLIPNGQEIELMSRHTTNEESRAKCLGITISVCEKTATIFNIYIRPRASHTELTQMLNNVEEIGRQTGTEKKMLLAGDFNASSPIWDKLSSTIGDKQENSDKHYTRIKEVRGRQISKFISRNDLICLNEHKKSPTYNGRCIDLAITSKQMINKWNTVVTSQHQHVNARKIHAILTIKNANPARGPIKTYERKVIKLNQLDNTAFIQPKLQFIRITTGYHRQNREQQVKKLNELTKITIQAVKNAQERITVTKHYKKANRTMVTKRAYLDRLKQLRKLRRMDNKIKESWQDRRLNKKYKTKRSQIKSRLISKLRYESIKEWAKLDTQKDMWERVSTIEREDATNITRQKNEELKTQKDINQVAETKFPKVDRYSTQWLQNAINSKEIRTECKISNAEVEYALRDLRSKKYKTPEGIRMDVFYKASQYIKTELIFIIKESFRLTHIPKECELTKGTIIPKKEKGKYRIVHVSNMLAALMELVALHRLEAALDKNRLLSASQYGFTPNRDRLHLCGRIIEIATNNKWSSCVGTSRAKRITALVSMDIEGAFDNVSQDHIITKLRKDLRSNTIIYWLSQFILNRRINIVYGRLKSKCRMMQKGVPQGSALGPILFNFMINDIEEGIEKPGIQELLKYADDIILIRKGYDRNIMQHTIQRLSIKLKNIGLKVNPQKSEIMVVRYGNNAKQNGRYKLELDNGTIKRVKQLNILGLPIDDKLRLDRDKIRDKITRATSRIHKIYNASIINNAKEWQTIISSILTCHMTQNCWPVLSVDKKAREWINEAFCKATKTIFEWPSNASNKTIRLLTGVTKCEENIRHIINQGMLGEHDHTFRAMSLLLEATSQTEANLTNEIRIDHEPRPLKEQLSRNRRYADPELYMDPNTHNLDMIYKAYQIYGYGPAWIIIETPYSSIAVEKMFDTILRIIDIRHEQYPITYFNTMALMLELANNKGIMNRKIIIDDDNAIVMALMNHRNNDWRIIQLREKLRENGWKMFHANKSTMKGLREITYRTMRDRSIGIAQEGIMDQQSREEFDRIMFEMNEGNYNEANLRRSKARITCREPNLEDYVYRNNEAKRHRKSTQDELRNYQSEICKQLTQQENTWQMIPINRIDGPKLLMLSDMLTNRQTQQLEHFNYDQHGTCNECNQETNGLHLTLHRATLCTAQRYKQIQSEVRETIERTGDHAVETTLKDQMLSQRLLRLLGKAAMGQD